MHERFGRRNRARNGDQERRAGELGGNRAHPARALAHTPEAHCFRADIGTFAEHVHGGRGILCQHFQRGRIELPLRRSGAARIRRQDRKTLLDESGGNRSQALILLRRRQ